LPKSSYYALFRRIFIQSPGEETCYHNISASSCDLSNFCGSSYDDSLKCRYPCISGETNDCPNGMDCYDTIGSVQCQNNGYCGVSREDAKSCDRPCTNFFDCAIGEECFEDIAYNECEQMHYCGENAYDTSLCNIACPTGHSEGCPTGTSCFLNISKENCNGGNSNIENKTDISNNQLPINYVCGSTRESAKECTETCMSGLDSDCPSGEHW